MKSIIILLVAATLFATCQDNTIVDTTNGLVTGYLSSDQSIAIYKGVPFAAPPIGDLRWKAPQPVEDWNGIRACTTFAPSPIQNKPAPFLCWTAEFIAQPEPLSEDCLYLNIWTAAKTKKEKKPVFVWIYGGGLSSGSANCAIYDGEEMAKKGVVFVSLNYRVGVLGYMAHPELSLESPQGVSGNYGLLDQIAALRWIQNNISAFGGDPDNVTIAGQSAGAFSVTALIASPIAKGLFHKAIPQSGGILAERLVENLNMAEEKGKNLMELAKSASLADLRNLSADELQRLSNDPAVGRFGLTLDDYLLPKHLLEHFQQGRHNQVPILTGWVTGDGALFGNTNVSLAALQEEVAEKYGAKAEHFFEIFHATNDEEASQVKNQLALISFAALPAYLLSIYTNSPSYLYQFSHVPPDKPDFPNYGAFHTAEVPYALHTLHTWERPWQKVDADLEETMSSYWTNFAKTGNPNGHHLPFWMPYDKSKGMIMELGDAVEIREALLKKEFAFLTNQE